MLFLARCLLLGLAFLPAWWGLLHLSDLTERATRPAPPEPTAR